MGKNAVIPAMLLAFLGFTLWTVSDALIKFLGAYPPVQLAFLCGVYSLASQIAFADRLGGLRATFAKPKLGLQIFRGLVICVCGLLSFYVFAHLPFTVAYAIIFLTPFVSKFLAVLMNGEKVPRLCWALSVVAFTGVLIVIRPGMMPFTWPLVAALAIPALFAYAYVLGRTIGEENQTMLSLNLFADCAMIAVFAVPTLLHFVPMGPMDFATAVMIGVLGFTGTLCVSLAYVRAPTAYVAPVHYTQIIWGVIWGVLFFGENPDVPTIIGAVMIIGSGLVLVVSGSRTGELEKDVLKI
ncbi:MAG: DMT family transporter [Alphaproteobacteria bacterium]|nr:DMT family transporter [Alphaproteobacteria bacterium]